MKNTKTKNKADKIKNIFAYISSSYDRANKAITMGMDSQWRNTLVRWSEASASSKILDCATGTGALAFAFAKQTPPAKIIGVDFCAEMLEEAEHVKEKNNISSVKFQMADIHELEFADQTFDVTAMAYGLRNVEDPVKVLKEMARVTKLGGHILLLETGKVFWFLSPFFYLYNRYVMPWIGGWITGQKSAYHYLEQSSRNFLSRKKFLNLLQKTNCFDHLEYKTLFFGASFIYKAQVKHQHSRVQCPSSGSLFNLIKTMTQKFSQPDVFFYCGLWMLLLLFCGTMEQKYIGLWQAQSKYFSSFFFLFYGIPLPSCQTIMAIILISLLLKITLHTQNIKTNAGSFVTHIGIILLLIGGFMTSLLSKEGYIVIPEGQKSNTLSDYHDVELAITNNNLKKTITIAQKSLEQQKYPLKTKNSLLPLQIKVFMKNTEPVKRKTPSIKSFKGFARIFELKQKKLEKINEDNTAGLTFNILKGNGQQETYSIYEGMPIQQTVQWNNNTYTMELRPAKTYLPFSIHLIDFQKKYYPGTDQPKSYQSVVEIIDETMQQKKIIKMNQPLRYKGYTFYQSSFTEDKNSESTILAVVKNKGRAFPYLSGLIICFGLLIHIASHMPFSKKQIKIKAS